MTTLHETLRPLGMGELLDRAIRLYRRNFFKFIGVIAVMQVPVALISLALTLATSDAVLEAIPDPAAIRPGENPFAAIGPGYYIGIAASAIVTIAEFILVSGVATAALARMVADSYLGEELGTLEAYRAIGKRWGPLVRAILLFLGAIFLLLFWSLVPCVGWLTGPGLLIVLAAIVFPLVAPVVVMENFGARKSIRRAWELVRTRFWWVFGFTIVLFIFSWVVVGGPQVLVAFLLNLAFPIDPASVTAGANGLRLVVETLVNLVFQLLYLPLQLTCLTLLYFDLRVRSEGLDLMLAEPAGAAAEPGQTGTTMRDLVAATSSLPERALFTGREWGRIAFLSVLVVIFYAGLLAFAFWIANLTGALPG